MFCMSSSLVVRRLYFCGSSSICTSHPLNIMSIQISNDKVAAKRTIVWYLSQGERILVPVVQRWSLQQQGRWQQSCYLQRLPLYGSTSRWVVWRRRTCIAGGTPARTGMWLKRTVLHQVMKDMLFDRQRSWSSVKFLDMIGTGPNGTSKGRRELWTILLMRSLDH